MTSSNSATGAGASGDGAGLAPDLGTVDRHGRELVVALRGDLDALRAPQVQEAIDAQIDDDIERVVFDAAEVEFMDSSGVRVLVIVQQRLADTGGSVVVRNASAIVLRLLEVTALDGRFIES